VNSCEIKAALLSCDDTTMHFFIVVFGSVGASFILDAMTSSLRLVLVLITLLFLVLLSFSPSRIVNTIPPSDDTTFPSSRCCPSCAVCVVLLLVLLFLLLQTLDNPYYELIGYSIYAMEDGQTATSHSLSPHTDTSHSPLLRPSVVKPFRTAKGQMVSGVRTEEK